jgi:hypothetical protein
LKAIEKWDVGGVRGKKLRESNVRD